jgi:hypothetical protein
MNRTAPLLAIALALAGCAGPNSSVTPQYDARFGAAVREARQRMTLNPTPSTDPVVGMDGISAREAQARYQGSFKAPPPVVNVINIGGAVRAGGGGQ